MARRALLSGMAIFCVFFANMAGTAAEAPLRTIVFGSCADQNLSQEFWKPILAQGPDLFLMLGDNVYADTLDMDVMRARYRQLGSQEGFRKLRDSVPVLAIWDDHDYGWNDAGREYPRRKESEQIFLDFWGVPSSSSRRMHCGIYGSSVFGPPGRRVQVIMLDTRYFRGPWKKSPRPLQWGKYVPNEDLDVPLLGEDQWEWLERELRRPAELRLILSGIQVLPNGHGWEKWGNLPHERDRLLRLLDRTNANGVLLLSGDRHLAEISRMEADDHTGVGYPLYEVTASSFNRGIDRPVDEANKYRVGKNYTGTNFGSIEIDWDSPVPRVTLKVNDTAGNVRLTEAIAIRDLRPEGN